MRLAAPGGFGSPDASDDVPEDASDDPGGAPPSAAVRTRPRAPAAALGVISLLIVALVISQQPGLIAAETRTDLILEPSRFLGQVFEMWDPTSDMGRIRNQGVGYLLPLGVVHLLGDALGVPAWLVSRLWIAAVLVVALWGFARLADELTIGRPLGRVLAASAYALSPLFIARVGITSWFTLGAALAPWCLLPLVRASRGGPVLRRAAVSGLTVAAVGGVNAAIPLAMLVLPVVWLVTRQRGPRRLRLSLVWGGAVVAATFWWILPLVLQGRLGYDFLSVSERAYTTTAFTPPFEVVRGLADWLAYARFLRTPFPPAWELATSGPLIVASGVVAALGVVGLARRDIPHRRFLVLAFGAGVVIMSAGYGGELGNPLAGVVEGLLDGPLGPLRSLYKFQPVVLLPLCLGLAHGVSVVVDAATRRGGDVWAGAVALVAGAAIVVSAYPLVGGNLLAEKPFDEVPSWWVEAAASVEDAPGRVLLLPGLPKSDSTWGYTAEEPLAWLMEGPWATRSIAPLGSTGATTVLDTIETAVARGGDPGLADFLARNGFSTVMVRNDAEWERYGAPSPQTVALALRASGLELDDSFGPDLVFDSDPLRPSLGLGQVEVYRVPGFEPGDIVTSYPTATAAVVSGDASAPLRLAQYGLDDRALILAADVDDGALPDEWIVTDTNRRRFTSFGLNRANGSHVLTAVDGGPNGVPLERGLLPGVEIEHQTVAVRSGVTMVEASSHGSLLVPIPETSPGRAVDGDPATAWIAGAWRSSEGQWIRLDLDRPVESDRLTVELLDDGPWRTRIEEIEVVTDTGSVTTPVLAGEGPQDLGMPPGPTSQITLVLASVRTRPDGEASAGIREIEIPGVDADARLAPPSEFVEEFSSPDHGLPTFVLDRSQVSPWSLLRRDEERSLRRVIELPRAGSMTLEAWVSPEPGPELLDLFDADPTFGVAASATLGDLPRFSPRNLVDGDPDTVWIGARPPAVADSQYSATVVSPEGVVPWQAEDRTPTVTMSWNQPRLVAELDLGLVPAYSTPTAVRVVGAGGEREADVGADGVARFDPLLTSSIEVSFPRVASYVVTGPTGQQVRPIALSSLTSPWLTDLLPGPLSEAAPIAVPCGEGPVITVGDEERQLSLSTTAEDLASLRDVEATICDDTPIDVGEGEVLVDSPNDDGAFVVSSLALADAAATGATAGDDPATASADDDEAGVGDRDPRIVEWGDVSRRVELRGGDAVVLNVKENANPGWTATLAGERLEPVTLDGWQQGFVVPAGPGGVVELDYSPNRIYSAGLVVGGLLLVLLLVAALLPGRPSRLAGVGEGSWPAVVDRIVVGIGAITVAGVAGLLAVPIAYLRHRRWRWSAVLAGSSFALAAVYVGLTQSPLAETVTGSRGYVATVLAIVAVLAVAVNLGSVSGADDQEGSPSPGDEDPDGSGGDGEPALDHDPEPSHEVASGDDEAPSREASSGDDEAPSPEA